MVPKFVFGFPTFGYNLTAIKTEEHKSDITSIMCLTSPLFFCGHMQFPRYHHFSKSKMLRIICCFISFVVFVFAEPSTLLKLRK